MKHCVELNDVCQMDVPLGVLDIPGNRVVQPKADLEKGGVMNGDMEFDEVHEKLPDSLMAALRTRFSPLPDVPSNIDQSILADARCHLKQQGPAALRPKRWRRVSVWQWTAIGSAVAAACVLVVAIQQLQPQSENSFTAESNTMLSDAVLTRDVDLNGRIDILDAFAIARQMRRGRDKVYDLNHDGRFDETDIDIVAREAVKL